MSFIKLVSTLAPQLEASLDANEPRFLTPLAATAQTVLVSSSTPSRTATGPSSESRATEATPEDSEIYYGARDLERSIEEPFASDLTSLLQALPNGHRHVGGDHKSVTRRQKTRKRAYNHVSAQHADEPQFQLDKEYTFEFYQHLLLFGGESLALDTLAGVLDLAPVLDGQPIQCMAAHKDPDTGKLETLWSFDIWHESLYEWARAAEEV